MENFILVIHIVIAIIIIGLIMIQQGKGAEMGASFGSGSSQTVFGAAGTGNLFSKLTAVAVTIFFITSFALAVIAKQSVDLDEDFIAPAGQEAAGEASVASPENIPAELPAAPASQAEPAAEGDLPAAPASGEPAE